MRYGSALGGSGNLEVDLNFMFRNFMFRVPLWPLHAQPGDTAGICWDFSVWLFGSSYSLRETAAERRYSKG